MPSPPGDRRKDRRIQAPVYCRPAGLDLIDRHKQPIDLSMGGLRMYTDEPRRVGELLKLELFFKDAPPVTYTAEVVWVESLPKGGPARFDVGLKFLNLSPDAIKLLTTVLAPVGD